METIKIFKCEKCEHPCYTNQTEFFSCTGAKWLSDITVTIYIRPEPDKVIKEVFKFGDPVEFYGEIAKKWMPGLYCGKTYAGMYQVKTEGVNEVFCYKKIRRPLMERMIKGQPVVVMTSRGEVKYYSFFKEFKHKDEIIILMHGYELGRVNWRLPTKAELDAIGHGGKGWLTSDGGE